MAVMDYKARVDMARSDPTFRSRVELAISKHGKTVIRITTLPANPTESQVNTFNRTCNQARIWINDPLGMLNSIADAVVGEPVFDNATSVSDFTDQAVQGAVAEIFPLTF